MNLKQIVSGSRPISGSPPVEKIEIGIPGKPQTAIIHQGKIYVYNTEGQSLISDGLVAARAIKARAITASRLRTSNKQFVSTLVWTPTSYRKASWSSGVIQWADGTISSINAGNTGNITQLTFIYYSGSSTLSKTTDYKNAVGNNKVLLASVSSVADVQAGCLITTFLSTGTTIDGNKVITGKIQSNDGKTYFDLNNGQMLISDANNSRVTLGKYLDFHGIKISRTGYNITENDYRLLSFISTEYGNILKVKYQGSAIVTIEDGETTGYVDISNDLSYFPGAYAFVETSANKKLRCNFQNVYDHTDGYTGELNIYDNMIKVTISRAGSSGKVNFNIYYYVFIDNTNI